MTQEDAIIHVLKRYDGLTAREIWEKAPEGAFSSDRKFGIRQVQPALSRLKARGVIESVDDGLVLRWSLLATGAPVPESPAVVPPPLPCEAPVPEPETVDDAAPVLEVIPPPDDSGVPPEVENVADVEDEAPAPAPEFEGSPIKDSFRNWRAKLTEKAGSPAEHTEAAPAAPAEPGIGKLTEEESALYRHVPVSRRVWLEERAREMCRAVFTHLDQPVSEEMAGWLNELTMVIEELADEVA